MAYGKSMNNSGQYYVSEQCIQCLLYFPRTNITAFALLHVFFTSLLSIIPVTTNDTAARQLKSFLLFPLVRTLLISAII